MFRILNRRRTPAAHAGFSQAQQAQLADLVNSGQPPLAAEAGKWLVSQKYS